MEINCCRLQQTTFESCLQPRAKARRGPVLGVESGVRVESRRQKVAPWRPPASKSPRAKSFVSGGTVRKGLIFLKWHGRGRRFEPDQVHQNVSNTYSEHPTPEVRPLESKMDASRGDPTCVGSRAAPFPILIAPNSPGLSTPNKT